MKSLIFLGIPKKFLVNAARKYAKVIIIAEQSEINLIREQSIEAFAGVQFIQNQNQRVDDVLLNNLAVLIDPQNTYIHIMEKTLIDAYEIIKHFQLPQSAYMNERIVRMVADKSEFRNSFISKTTGNSHSVLIKSQADLESVVRELGKRIIVKPVNGEASTDVMIVSTAQDIPEIWQQIKLAKQRDKNIRFLAEEYFTGKQYSVDVYWSKPLGYVFTPLCEQGIGFDLGYPDFRTCYSKTVDDMNTNDYELITTKLADLLQSNGMTFSIMHIEFRVNAEGELFVIEINPRIGGLRNLIYNLSYGFSHIDNVMRSILNLGDLTVKSKLIVNSAVVHFWADTAGKFSLIRFRGSQGQAYTVRLEKVRVKAGDQVGPPNLGYQKVGYTVISAAKKGDINSAISEVFSQTKVITE